MRISIAHCALSSSFQLCRNICLSLNYLQLKVDLLMQINAKVASESLTPNFILPCKAKVSIS